jgi:hypothetical protein
MFYCDQQWAAILLNAVSTLKGTRERIEQILNVREHMEKAIQYSPNDPTAHYLLGEWHYSCNQVSWVERKLAGNQVFANFVSLLNLFYLFMKL